MPNFSVSCVVLQKDSNEEIGPNGGKFYLFALDVVDRRTKTNIMEVVRNDRFGCRF